MANLRRNILRKKELEKERNGACQCSAKFVSLESNAEQKGNEDFHVSNDKLANANNGINGFTEKIEDAS